MIHVKHLTAKMTSPQDLVVLAFCILSFANANSLEVDSNTSKINPIALANAWFLQTFDVSGVREGRRYLTSKHITIYDADEANCTCAQGGGYLFEPDDNEEYDFVRKFVMKVGGTNLFYTGMIFSEKLGFVYGRSDKPIQIQKWSSGQPNNRIGKNGRQRCTAIHIGSKRNGALVDNMCNHVGKFVCEVHLPTSAEISDSFNAAIKALNNN